MVKSYYIGFEDVELVDGLSEDEPVWLYMRATLYNEGVYDQPLWIGEVGSLPPDPNRPVLEAYPIGEAGRYADHLVIGQPVPNQTDTGIPNFSIGPVAVAPGQVLELMIIMLPKVWFETKRVPPETLDRLAYGTFSFLLVTSGFGIIGGLAAGLFGTLFGGGDQEIDVPCFNSLISARHVLNSADLNSIEALGSARYGPQDNEAYVVCKQPINAYYRLSVNNSGMFFPKTPEPNKELCTLEPRAFTPAREQFEGPGWGDTGDRISDCIHVYVSFTDELFADVEIYQRSETNSVSIGTFTHIRATREVPLPLFSRNVFDDRNCPNRSVTPNCRECLRFVNLPVEMRIHPALLLLGIHPGSHVGTRPLFPIHIETDKITSPSREGRCQPCREQKHTQAHIDRVKEPMRLGIRHNIRQLDEHSISLWPTGTVPFRDIKISSRLNLNKQLIPPPYWPVSWVLHCSPEFRLATYQELKADSGCMGRLRYTRYNSEGNVIADIMLSRLPAVIR